MARIDDPPRLDEQRVAFGGCARAVLEALSDHEHFAGRQFHETVSKLDFHASEQDNEHFVRVLVMVPDEISAELHQFELVVVHFRDHSWSPMI